MNTLRPCATTSALLLSIAACASLLAGCNGPEQMSYRSTSLTPQTVTILDTVSGETLWTVDVPVGKQVDMKFLERAATAEEFGSDILQWTISPVGQPWQGAVSEVRVPPPSSRRIDVRLRESGEARQTPVVQSLKSPPGSTMPGITAPEPTAAPAAPATPSAPASSAPGAPAAPAIVLPDAKQPAPGQKP